MTLLLFVKKLFSDRHEDTKSFGVGHLYNKFIPCNYEHILIIKDNIFAIT